MKKILFLAIGMFSLSAFSHDISYKKQKEIDSLIQTGIYYYWNGGDLKKVEKNFFKGITLKGRNDLVENAFKKASSIDPTRLDLRFSIASAQIIQKKIPEALKTFKDIIDLDANNFDANLLYAVYSKVNGDLETFNKKMKLLATINNKEAQKYKLRLESVDKITKTKLKVKANNTNTDVIVILGYALNNKGEMRPPLIERLNQGLALSKANPNAKIIVTGGVPKQGVTESYLMKKWLIKKGISANKISIEGKSRDTVENAIFATKIIKSFKPKKVTIISSASHMRRALTIFGEIKEQQSLNYDLDNLVYLDYDSLEEAQKVSINEYLVIHRDLMRASGIWNYPGIQR